MRSEKRILTYKGAVLTWECDSNKHMNVMYYVNKFEFAGRGVSGHFGMSRDTLIAKNLGVVVVEQKINYFKEVLEDDLLEIESELNEVKGKMMKFTHYMRKVGHDEVVSQMEAKIVLIDMDLRKAAPIPPEVLDRVNDYLHN